MSLDIEHNPPEGMALSDQWPAIEETVEWFADAMFEKFVKVQHKGYWQYVSWEYLHERLWTEYEELRRSLSVSPDNVDREAIIEECVDVANCALMLADWWRKQS